MSEFLLLLNLTRNVLASLRKREAEYRAEVEEWYTNGDGQSPNWVAAATQPWFDPEWDNPDRMVNIGGRGYSFPHCIHGTSHWTDYDNICGGCEDGSRTTEIARDIAFGLLREFNERLEWAAKAPKSLPQAIREELWAYVAEPTTRYPKA